MIYTFQLLYNLRQVALELLKSWTDILLAMSGMSGLLTENIDNDLVENLDDDTIDNDFVKVSSKECACNLPLESGGKFIEFIKYTWCDTVYIDFSKYLPDNSPSTLPLKLQEPTNNGPQSRRL